MDTTDPRPIDARVTTAMIGSTTAMVPVSWDERDTILYALGVGAGLGAPERDLQFTTENTGGVSLKAIPSFLTVLNVGVPPPAMTDIDMGRMLHAEHRIAWLRPMPAKGHAFMRNRIAGVEDKGSGAIIHNTATLFADAEGQIPLAHSNSSIFIMGGGGFGGPRSPSAPFVPPARVPDVAITHETRPEQALLYRLSGDRHRLHSDPQFARDRGFARPILHGLCTYGFACRALIEALCDGDSDRLTAMSVRFSRPVLPGQTLTTHVWREADGSAMFRMLNPEGEAVLERGTASIKAQAVTL